MGQGLTPLQGRQRILSLSEKVLNPFNLTAYLLLFFSNIFLQVYNGRNAVLPLLGSDNILYRMYEYSEASKTTV